MRRVETRVPRALLCLISLVLASAWSVSLGEVGVVTGATEDPEPIGGAPYILQTILDDPEPYGIVWQPFHSGNDSYHILNPQGSQNEDGYPAMAPRPENYALLEEYSTVSEALGLGPVEALDPSRRGAGDIAFASDFVPAALDGLGAMGGDTHGPEEWVDLDSLVPQIRRAAMLIHHLTHTR